jgi:hypothetical protein
MRAPRRAVTLAAAVLLGATAASAAENLIEDPSFELPKDRDPFGLVFARWGGWKYEGDCSFEVGRVAHSGKLSCLLVGASAPKIRVTAPDRELPPGRYRVTAFLRGVEIGAGTWNQTTELMFDGKYIPLGRNGTFGWSKLTYVGEVKEKKKVSGPSFGLMAPGWLWIDDVTLEKVPDDTPLTDKPLLGPEEAPIAPPGELGVDPVRCPGCGYRNRLAWKACYACGTPLEEKRAAVAGPPVKPIASFEEKSPFSGGTVVGQHATDGTKALRIDRSYAVMDGDQDWTGYDYLKADLHTDAPDPLRLYVEIRDKASKDYWTRVNYVTVVPPGSSTLIVPVQQLYVGEKSRPGRRLLLADITRLVFSIDDKPPAPLFVDHVRLERDDSMEKARFDGLYAFDFGTGSSPVMEGFTPVTPATLYSKGRGYGLKDAKIWRAVDALQPDPLYQDFLCIESGGLAVDVPNGRYRVVLNMDSPSGFWGEYQVYSKRAVLAQGREVVADTMDFEAFRRKYFRFWDSEDLPAENTFDKVQKAYFNEKRFEVEVTDGQLSIGFRGENWACSVSAVVIYPAAKAAEGERFLKLVEDRRRFHFDNYFKRVLHRPSGDPLAPTGADRDRGYVLFTRDIMKDVYYNDTPAAGEVCARLAADAFAGEYEPVTVALVPLQDLGTVTVSAGDLHGPGGTIPAAAVDVGFVSYRVTRVTMEGSVYTIAPRFVMPAAAAPCPRGLTRRFWLTVRTPADAKPGLYKGMIAIQPGKGGASELPLEFTVRAGTLDPVDVPAGPWGHTIGIPWPGAEARDWEDAVAAKCLRKLREYGFTSFSGLPEVSYKGFKDGKPVLDFARGDAQMKRAKEAGFTLPVVTYCAFPGLSLYYQDTGALGASGLKDYSALVQAIFSEVQRHADADGWLPVYWNLGDEPIGDDLRRSAENAEAYRKAFPKGPPFFTAASSYAGKDPSDPHFRLGKALHVADWNSHSEDSVTLLRRMGSDWAFYNDGNRWTFGTYLYKAARQFDMKFRLSWHWNANAGDPYYALDCREDDFAWCNATPDGRLVPTIHFEQLREGLDDYRLLLTLARTAKGKAGTPEAKAAEELVASRLASFKLGQRDHDALFGVDDWATFRRRAADALEALRR